MSQPELVRVGFADAGAQLQGVAVGGAGALLAVGGVVEAVPGFELADAGGNACRIGTGGSYDVTLEPLAPPAELGDGARAWFCRARGTVAGRALDGTGSIMRSLADDRFVLERVVSAWLGSGLAVALNARRPRRAAGHGDEQLHAAMLRGEPLESVAVADARLSSTYDGDGLLLRCGLELWDTEEAEFALRYGGTTVARGELAHADGCRTQVAFMSFRGDGVQGPGRYEITRR